MFVTSDVFDLARIARFRRVHWKENLICGVAIHGAETRGYQSAAAWLLDGARLCGLMGEMKWAGYNVPDAKRTRSIKVSSFERLARGELKGACNATGLLLEGEREATGCQRGALLFGGEASTKRRRKRGPNGPEPIADHPYRPFDADFCFPLNQQPRETAAELLRRSVELTDADYGYHFVMDDMCGPTTYAWGIAAPLDWSQPTMAKTREVSEWREFVAEGRLWTGKWPAFRDLFEVNLISERHTSVPIEGLGYLTDWIRAQPARGELEDIGRGRMLWRLTSAEILNVRPLLDGAGVLFSCPERVYRDLTPNFRDSWKLPT
jgi:hypothetical protein